MSDSDLARPWVAIKINVEEILLRPAPYGISLAKGSSDIARIDLSVGPLTCTKKRVVARFDYQKAGGGRRAFVPYMLLFGKK